MDRRKITSRDYYETSTNWFDADKATRYESATYWDGRNSCWEATGSWKCWEAIWKTASGRFVLEEGSRWQGSTTSYVLFSVEEAKEWAVKAGLSDEELEELFDSTELQGEV